MTQLLSLKDWTGREKSSSIKRQGTQCGETRVLDDELESQTATRSVPPERVLGQDIKARMGKRRPGSIEEGGTWTVGVVQSVPDGSRMNGAKAPADGTNLLGELTYNTINGGLKGQGKGVKKKMVTGSRKVQGNYDQ